MAEINLNSLTNNLFRVLNPTFSTWANKNSARNRSTSKISTIVLHWTAGSSLKGALDTLYQKNYGYHFIIDTDGAVVQTDQLNRNVPHAGVSYGPEGKDVNVYSIGISIVALDAGYIKPEQVDSINKLILDLLADAEFKKNIKWLTGHHQISPGRKVDPYDFPFDETIKKIKAGGHDLTYWRAGMAPFPKGLSDCQCTDNAPVDVNGTKWCRSSKGSCKGQGGYHYNLEKVSTTKEDADKIIEIYGGVNDTESN
tara:strand:+ start:1030 stop:1791 length:762 start_codon:yes stop_codon:yes gene_type:complete